MKLTDRQKTAIVILGTASLLPIWRSGLRENMNLWQWIINHTIFGPPSEYVPEEYYIPDNPVPMEYIFETVSLVAGQE